MGSLLKLVAGMLLWGAALYGVLQIGLIAQSTGHAHGRFTSICGPWGCAPPTEALLAMHGFWIILICPPSWLLIRSSSVKNLKSIGFVTTGFSLIAMLTIVVWEGFHYLPLIQPEQPAYFIRRVLFRITL